MVLFNALSCQWLAPSCIVHNIELAYIQSIRVPYTLAVGPVSTLGRYRVVRARRSWGSYDRLSRAWKRHRNLCIIDWPLDLVLHSIKTWSRCPFDTVTVPHYEQWRGSSVRKWNVPLNGHGLLHVAVETLSLYDRTGLNRWKCDVRFGHAVKTNMKRWSSHQGFYVENSCYFHSVQSHFSRLRTDFIIAQAYDCQLLKLRNRCGSEVNRQFCVSFFMGDGTETTSLLCYIFIEDIHMCNLI